MREFQSQGIYKSWWRKYRMFDCGQTNNRFSADYRFKSSFNYSLEELYQNRSSEALAFLCLRYSHEILLQTYIQKMEREPPNSQ